MSELECPQCRSSKVSQESVLELARCNYCTNEFYPTSYNELHSAVFEATKVELPNFKNPLPLTNITAEPATKQLVLYLDGLQDAEYKLKLDATHSGKLYRRKTGAERNQFGSHWTNPEEIWPTNLILD